MAHAKTYRSTVHSDNEFADIPLLVEFTVEEATAREIIRLAQLVKANALHKVEKFDCRACYLKFDPEEDPEEVEELGEANEIYTEGNRLTVTDTDFWFCCYLKSSNVEIESELQPIIDLATHLGLAELFAP